MKKKLVGTIMSMMLVAPTAVAMTGCGANSVVKMDDAKTATSMYQITQNATVDAQYTASYSFMGGQPQTSTGTTKVYFNEGIAYGKEGDTYYDMEMPEILTGATQAGVAAAMDKFYEFAKSLNSDAISVKEDKNSATQTITLDLKTLINKTIENVATNHGNSIEDFIDQLLEDLGKDITVESFVVSAGANFTAETTMTQAVTALATSLNVDAEMIDGAFATFTGMMGLNWQEAKTQTVAQFATTIDFRAKEDDETYAEYLYAMLSSEVLANMSIDNLINMAIMAFSQDAYEDAEDEDDLDPEPVAPVNDPVDPTQETAEQPTGIMGFLDAVISGGEEAVQGIMSMLASIRVTTATVVVKITVDANNAITSVGIDATIAGGMITTPGTETTEPVVQEMLSATFSGTLAFSAVGTTTVVVPDETQAAA